MNAKEIGEIKRRIRRDRTNMTVIYGCYVRDNGEIISTFKSSVALMPEPEVDKYMKFLKGALGGTHGKTLNDITFSTKQVSEKTAQHTLLMDLRQTGLDDEDKRNELFAAIIPTVQMKTNYLILIGCDTYDVPFKTSDDVSHAEAGDEAFTYLLCSICPVKTTTPSLHYVHEESKFHDGGILQAASTPVLGFLFPAFDNRSTNIYGALLYNKDTKNDQQDFVEAVFGTKTPDAADRQKEGFNALLVSQLDEDCSMDVLQTIHERAAQTMQMAKESKSPDIVTVDRNAIESMLNESGVDETRINDFGDAFEDTFGEGAMVPLTNLIDTKHCVIKTAAAVIKVDADRSHRIEIKTIGGQTFICVPADGEVEMNGIPVSIPD